MLVTRHARLGLALLVLVLALRTARADTADDDATAARRALIALRILAYDKALDSRAPGSEVVIFIVAGADEPGRAERDQWQAGFALLPKVKAGGRPVRAVAVDYHDAQTLDALAARMHPAAMIVADGLAGAAAALREVARVRHVITMSRRERDIRDGYAVGLIAGDKRDEIVVNLEAARGEGAQFDAGFLQLARMVDAGGASR
jgi:YfiR/HmsC-like